MTFHIKGTKHRHKVRFASRAMASSSTPERSPSSSRFEDLEAVPSRPAPPGFVIEELSSDSDQSAENIWEQTTDPVTMTAAAIIPDLFTSWPPVRDDLRTETSEVQNETVQAVLSFLSGDSGEFPYYNRHGIPHLDRERHIRFLHSSLGKLPEGFVAADAARPWFFYWALCALCTLGEDVSPYRESLVSTVRPIQNASGGFGGGHGQMSHLAPTYAIVLSLAMVGGDEALEVIDRKAMWKWLGILKQPDGGFQMCVGGEEDVRGAYCAATIISILNLPLELSSTSQAISGGLTSLLDGLAEYIRRCQTFEGGISSRPDAEAHGGYAFCALACLCILDDPAVIIPEYLNLPALISWLSARQHAPEGGFAGRTNKLVDGCYSHWVGASWPLVAAALKRSSNLYSREGLIRYILCACQDTSRRGGLRDKPGKNSDGYHTCYVLSGLSSAQHLWTYNGPNLSNSTVDGYGVLGQSIYRWIVSDDVVSEDVFDENDRVCSLHPVFVVPAGVAERTRTWYEARGGF